MKTTKRILALLTAITLIFSVVAVAFPTVYAANKADIYIAHFPRGEDPNQANWGHPKINLMNGWSIDESSVFPILALDSYTGKKVYCIEPGVTLWSGDTLEEKGESYWDDLPDINKTIDGNQIKKLIGRILMYGYTGNVNLSWVSTNASDRDKIGNMIATQIIIWETIVGERNEDFSHKSPPSNKDALLDMINKNHPVRTEIMEQYNRIVSSVQNHSTIPSFCETSISKAQTIDLSWDGSKYTTTLTDSNGVLSDYNFSSDKSGVTFSKSGNKLTISSTTAPSGTVTITAERNNSKRKGLIVWTDYHFGPDGELQDAVDYTSEVSDPVSGYIKLAVSLGTLEIIKTTQNNGGTVSGFQFEVRNSAGTLMGMYTSTSSGKISVPNLNAGMYSVKEVNLSSDFVTPTPNPKNVEVKAGQTASVSFDNIKKRGVITVKKTDTNPTMGGYSLSGAVFEVRDSGGTLVDTITTGTDGKAQTKILPLGAYRIKETKAPYGFVIDSTTHTATLSGTQGNVDVVYAPDVTIAEQPQVGRINIEKSNSTPNLGDYDLSGAVFEICNSSGTLVDTITTDSQGKAQSKDLKLGDYTVTEKSAPYGYVRNTNAFSVKLTYGDQSASTVYATARVPERPQTGIIRVSKNNANSGMGDYALNGAVFEVRAAQDVKRHDGSVIYSKGDLADTITTNAAGEASTKELPLGSYTVTEKTAPYGYILNTNSFTATLSYGGQEVSTVYAAVSVPEQPQVGTITITKLDKATGTRAQGDSTLNGAVFEIYSKNVIKKLNGAVIYAKDQLVDTLYCGSKSSATSKELPLGDYYYIEKTPPSGYTHDAGSYPITIGYAGQNVSVTKVYGDLKNKVIEGTIALVKHSDESDPNVEPNDIQIEMPLEGAVFQVYLKSAGSYDKALATERDLLTTNEDGYAKTKLLPYGIYTVKETFAPGDRKLVKPFDVFISAEGKVYRYILNDINFQSLVKIVKKDAETGKTIPAAGVSFKVKDLSTGKWVSQSFNYPVPTTIDVFETVPDGTLVMPESLKSGDYELHEVSAPYGYVLSKTPVKFTIHSTQENQEIIEVIMANNPAKGIIKLEKQGNMLTGVEEVDTPFGTQLTPVFSLTGLKGATFNVIAAEDIITPDGTKRYSKGQVVDTIITNANGYAETKQLYLGNYKVIEVEAPYGFVRDEIPHPVSLVYEGQEVPVVSSQIGIGNTRQMVEIELQKLMEKPVNAPENFDAYADVVFGLFADQNIKSINGEVVIEKGSLVALMQIDSTGKGIVSGELPFAKYYVQELQTNLYYQLNETKYPVTAEYKGQDVVSSKVQVNNGGVALPNELKLGRIIIEKTGEMLVCVNQRVGKGDVQYTPQWELRGLPDVTFEIIAAEDIYDVYGRLLTPKGTVVDTVTTNGGGKATSKLLHLGKYNLVETAVPFGYVSDGQPVPVTIGIDCQLVDEVLEKGVSIFNERQKAKITLNKVMERPENALAGFNPYAAVQFGLYVKTDVISADGEVIIPAEALLEYFGVDKNGKGVITTELPFGQYFIKEKSTAAGYKLNDAVYDVVFGYASEKGAMIEIAANNGEPIVNELMRGSLKVIKTFEGKDTPIAGVPFTITGTTVVGTSVEINVSTDENGEILLENLLVGNYTVKELESDLTVGYVLSPEENAVVAADEVAEMTIHNVLQRGDLRIIKTFEGTSTPIKGVNFTVSGTSIAGFGFEKTFKTDENGEIFIEGLPVGDYSIKEIGSKLTAGYVLSDEQTAAVAADEITEMKLENKLIRGEIKILKTDAETGEPLAGAVFGLYDMDGNLIAEKTTGDDGYAVFADVPYGVYKIREISAPEGYKATDKAFKVKIRENGETVELEIQNKRIPEKKPLLPSFPNTGDDSNITPWLIVMGASVAALVGLSIAGRRRKKTVEAESYGD